MGGRTPPHGLVRIGLGRGAFLPSPSPFPFLLSYSFYLEGFLVQQGKEGVLLLVGVGDVGWNPMWTIFHVWSGSYGES